MKDVLIVLGSPNSPEGELSDISKSRLNKCLNLYVKGKVILCTGGWGPHFNTAKQSHASYAKAYLLGQGVEEHDFLDFGLSSNTVDDAVKSKQILSKIEGARLTVISSDYHMDRVKLIFNIVLSTYEIQYVSAKSSLSDKDYKLLAEHEEKAIDSIMKEGLYY